MKLHIAAWLVAGLVVGGCASSPSAPAGSGVLEPVESVEKKAETPAAPAPSPTLEKLLLLLKSHGYDGIGLEYESEATLELLQRVFSDPKATKRRIKLIYTGLAMSYDALHYSLTIGGSTDVNAILAFIQKNVPSR